MPSYKIYKKIENWKLNSIISKDWTTIEISDDFDSSTKQKINKMKNNFQNATYKQEDSNYFEFSYNNQLKIGDQIVKVPEKFHIILFKEFLAIQINQSKSYLLIEKYLKEKISVILFSDHELIQIFNRLKNQLKNEDLNISIHRLIVENTFIESDQLKELNISAKNVFDLDLYKEIVKNSKKFRAITLRINGLAEKNITIRMGDNQILVYGNHDKDILIKLFELITNI